MKTIAIADPIAPAKENDIRESVKDLIQKHRGKIDQVQEGIPSDPIYDATKHDDMWIIVRFLLSHGKKVKPPVKVAKSTLQFRAQHKLDDEDIRGYPLRKETEDCPNNKGWKLLEDVKQWFQKTRFVHIISRLQGYGQ
jgi:ribosomal protein L18E